MGSKDSKNENRIFSPLSVSLCLGMVKVGAVSKSRTSKELEKVFHYPSDNKILSSGSSKIIDSVNALNDEKNTVEVANKIYLADKSEFKMRKEFLQVTEKSFKAPVQQLDFTQSKNAAGIINKWAETKTRGKISNVVSPGKF